MHMSYYQPVLFYSALGHIGHKGIVGSKINHTKRATGGVKRHHHVALK